jgi:hypothetical protein
MTSNLDAIAPPMADAGAAPRRIGAGQRRRVSVAALLAATAPAAATVVAFAGPPLAQSPPPDPPGHHTTGESAPRRLVCRAIRNPGKPPRRHRVPRDAGRAGSLNPRPSPAPPRHPEAAAPQPHQRRRIRSRIHPHPHGGVGAHLTEAVGSTRCPPRASTSTVKISVVVVARGPDGAVVVSTLCSCPARRGLSRSLSHLMQRAGGHPPPGGVA